ncbi:hypothetical protein [Orientia tsutsugamushi]|uniref:Uncharacterized protein n=1 Tax=Orientia tsutsugamushi str. TA716 TaxID=1359175 RepID=A0A0F3PBT3_ORITS|nr:hypothetical protein [Orientia tsutsugamushi]KJV77758.1 hypothetical protein OTSTA716_0048 [Orientia tsutsugamushi str. TA716]
MVQNLRNLASNNCKITNNNSRNHATVFYRFIGNFVPAEWKDLIGDNGKALSKTSKQLLSWIVYKLHIYYNNDIDELQDSYYFFEKELQVCQRRVRQCLVELQKACFIEIEVENRTIIKNNFKLCNVPCIKLLKNFQRFTEKEKKLSFYNKKIFTSICKNLQVNLKKVSGTYIRYIYIDIIIKK